MRCRRVTCSECHAHRSRASKRFSKVWTAFPEPKPPIRAVASFYGPTDLARWREANPFIRDYLDDLCGPEGLPVRSPILRVAQIDAPVLLVHGDRDENVPVEQVQAMAEALKSHGKEVETFIVPGGTHFFTEQQNAQTRRKLFDFLRRHLNRS